MSKRHEIKFKSYDRLFPNQATMPRGGFGNLIALPLQKEARSKGNSVFIDERFHPYEDQWEFLAQISRLSEDEIGVLISKLCPGSELGTSNKTMMSRPNRGREELRPGPNSHGRSFRVQCR